MSGGRTERHIDDEYLMSGIHSLGETNKLVADYGLDAKEFSDWTMARGSIVAESTTAPDGTLTGVKLIEDGTATSSHYISSGWGSIIDDTMYTWKMFVKAGNKKRCLLRGIEGNPYTDRFNLQVDMDAGTVSAEAVGDVTLEDSSIIPYPEYGWYLATITVQFGSAADNFNNLYLYMTESDESWEVSYSGDNSSYIYIWGAKMTEPTTTLRNVGADFKSCGAMAGLYIKNTTKDINSLIATVTEDEITTDDDLPWDSLDVYEIYKTATKDSFISSDVVDVSRGWRSDPAKMNKGWRFEDEDLDRYNQKIFGPGQPEGGR